MCIPNKNIFYINSLSFFHPLSPAFPLLDAFSFFLLHPSSLLCTHSLFLSGFPICSHPQTCSVCGPGMLSVLFPVVLHLSLILSIFLSCAFSSSVSCSIMCIPSLTCSVTFPHTLYLLFAQVSLVSTVNVCHFYTLSVSLNQHVPSCVYFPSQIVSFLIKHLSDSLSVPVACFLFLPILKSFLSSLTSRSLPLSCTSLLLSDTLHTF